MNNTTSTNLKVELVKLVSEHGIFALANILHQITVEESDNETSPNGLKDRGPMSINNHRILALHLSGALDEMDEIVREVRKG